MAADWFQRVPHDLRDPLSPLQTAVYLLRSADIGAQERAQMLELIERQGVRMAQMIDELSDCLRAQRGQLLARQAEVDLSTLAALAIVRPDAAAVHLEPGAEHLCVLGDEARLLQLLRILRELRLSREELLPAPLVLERDGDAARLHRCLACMPELLAAPEALLHAPLPAALAEGLGLQLPLAGAIAREHGGELRLEALPGRQVRVEVRLPRLQDLQAGAG